MSRSARTTAGRAFAASASALLALTLLSGAPSAARSGAAPLQTEAAGTGGEHPCPAPRP
jgi:hypothetical protein